MAKAPMLVGMSVVTATKAGFSAAKSHWFFFLLATSVIVGLALAYDGKNPGVLRSKFQMTLGKLPLVGGWF